MKKVLFVLLFPLLIFSQAEDIERYKIYPTENNFISLQLDTMTGEIMQVQISTSEDAPLLSTLSDFDWGFENGVIGQFKLYPTKNSYNFIMQDVTNGRVWQVQWNVDPEYRFVNLIYETESMIEE